VTAVEARDRLGHTRGGFDLAVPSDIDIPGTIRAAVAQRPQFRIEQDDPEQMVLRRRVNWATWGETVQLTWYPVSGGVHVDVLVSPVLQTTLHDWGQGRRDVTAIHQALTAVTGG
jgi:hypothetical protein